MEGENDLDILARLSVPIVWHTLEEYNVRIEDLEDSRFEEAMKFIKVHFVPHDILSRCGGLADDPDQIQTFLERMLFNMQDYTSLIAVDNVSEKIIGVLINRVMRFSEHSKTQSRVRFLEGDSVRKIIKIWSLIIARSNVFQYFDTDCVLRNYILCVKPRFRRKGIGRQLMLTSFELAASLEMGAVMGIYTTGALQQMGKSLGMEILAEIFYIDYIIDGEMVFDDPGAGNYTIALMARRVEPTETVDVEADEAEIPKT
ncbi:uncharacterized protein LOC123292847 [Chrysoperla carnea]|uniref:uncharacterized protein LOC123292847 n=1 Tax=Chrysoperla carnea TaxID=189513 RepID=UPI001D090156|nr:uncharacterized protein LOC123292847 [Chrysoperla carnea]